MKYKTLLSLLILVLPLFISPTSGGNAAIGSEGTTYPQIQGVETFEPELQRADDPHLADWRAARDSINLPDIDASITGPSVDVTDGQYLVTTTGDTLEATNIDLDAPPCKTCLKDARPLTIESSRDLRKLDGSGTADDPYVITGFNFTDSRDRSNLLQIFGISEHILITGNEFNGEFGSLTSILLINSANIRIENNNITRNGNGIVATDVNNLVITGNNIYENSGDSITVNGAGSLTIDSNNIYSNGMGVVVGNAQFGSISTNSISYNGDNGLSLANAIDFTIDSNTIFNNVGTGIFFDDSHGNVLSNNEVFGNGYAGGAVAVNAMDVFTFGENKVTLDAGFFGSGLYLDPSHDNTVVGNNVYDNAGVGVILEWSNNTVIDGNTINNNGLSGIFFNDSSLNSITNNVVTGNGFAFDTTSTQLNGFDLNSIFMLAGFFGSGLYLDPSHFNDVTGNTFSGNNGDGVLLEYSTNTLIDDNIVSDNGLTGVFFIDSDDNTITNNQITGSGSTASALIAQSSLNPFEAKLMAGFFGSGLYLDPSHRNTVTDNVVLGNDGNGIFLDESTTTEIARNSILSNGGDGVFLLDSSSNTIDANLVTDNGAGSAALMSNLVTVDNIKTLAGFFGSGLYLDPSPNNVVTNNVVSGSTGVGIYFLETNNSVIEGNTVFENGAHGIFLQDSSFNTIASNVINDNGYALGQSLGLDAGFFGSGLYLDPSHFNDVMSNNISRSAGDGILSEASTNSFISDNRVLDNVLYGINLDALSASSTVADNNFDGNDGTGSQGRDDGVANVISSNFWSDANNNDTNYDGISDEPYVLDGDAGTADTAPSNIPEGLNFYTAQAESSPRKLNADSEGSPLTFKIYMDDGFRVLNVSLDSLWLNGTINPYSYHIIDILTFTVTFDRLQVNALVNALGLEPEYYVTFEVTGRINDGLLDLTARDQVLVHQDEDNTLVLVVGLTGGMAIPVVGAKKSEGRISKFFNKLRRKEE